MELKRCPGCGSTYFLSSRSTDKIIFHVDNNNSTLAASEQEISPSFATKSEKIYCGACSWEGASTDLAPPLV